MKQLLFPDDTQFWFETLRLFGNASYGGTDFGEVLVAAGQVTPGDYDSWHDAYEGLARRLEKEADGSRGVTRRDLLVRASSYHFTAGFFLHANPSDPRVGATYDDARRCFHRAADLYDPPIEPIEIPYEGTVLEGYFYRASGQEPRPLVVMHSGLDGGAEELHFQGAAAGREHGYHLLTFDGPGQPSAIRRGLTFRPDWENVIGPVLDAVAERDDVDHERIALWGVSFGGYLAPRAAAFEPRLSAVVACDGIYDAAATITAALPWDRAEIDRRVQSADEELLSALAAMRTGNSTAQWAFDHGRYVLGATSDLEFLAKLRAYYLGNAVAEQINCPVLVCEAAGDLFFAGRTGGPRDLYDHLSGPKTLLTFTAEEGADAHCHVGAERLLTGRVYDWLDTALSRTGTP
jgi:dienelactone hydrolase